MRIVDYILNVSLPTNAKFIGRGGSAASAAGNASIVMVVSWWGREGHVYFSAYCASKAAAISLTQSVAAELAPDIRVNSVAPGNIDTPMHDNALAVEAERRKISAREMQILE